ncbi:MAG TPA: methylated-DNA--[protein]-cysteine S-methyltransferase [Actinomycetota bacterium]|nr:methylated-DNA--[protein]-cysteine S-methyltransferase [Actinomycetota bacterium]
MGEVDRVLREARAPEGVVEEAVRRLTAAAEADVDVAFAETDSPFGRLLVAVTPRGLVRLAYPNEAPDDVLDELARRLSPRVLRSARRLDPVRRQLDEYFERRRRRFDVSVDWAMTGGFVRKVLRATARIPYGDVRSYREVARRAGNARATRAAGNALGSNPIPIVVPCHRVVRSGGGLGGYTGGIERKEFLLELEGANVP